MWEINIINEIKHAMALTLNKNKKVGSIGVTRALRMTITNKVILNKQTRSNMKKNQ